MMMMVLWQAVVPHNVTCSECQLTPAALDISDNLHGTGGSDHPVCGHRCFLQEWVSRDEHGYGAFKKRV